MPMTNSEKRRHHRHARTLAKPAPASSGETLYLLVPEGLDHDDEICALARELGCSTVVSPHEGRSRAHDLAAAAGLDVSRPVVWREGPPKLAPLATTRPRWWSRLLGRFVG